MPTLHDVLTEQNKPVIGLDEIGCINYVNDQFEKFYGWEKTELLGRPVTMIIPKEMHDAHHIGFSRFLTTGAGSLLQRSLPLPVQCKDGRVLQAMHFIVAEKRSEQWSFAAVVTPTSK